MKRIIYLAMAIFTLASCNKDQALVKDLEGDWEIKKWKIDGVLSKATNGSMEFKVCKLKEDDCDGNWSFSEEVAGDIVIRSRDFTYAVSESGNEMFITIDYGNNFIQTWECEVTLDGDELELEAVVGSEKYVFELERD